MNDPSSSAADAERAVPHTERVHPGSVGIDARDAAEICGAMHAADREAFDAVGAVLADVAAAVERVSEAFADGGRLVYFGAGTSGRLGVLDASECPPTFGVSPDLVTARIAGGDGALRSAIEGAEDDPAAGAAAVDELAVGRRDVVCGIAASGTTPYVLGALLAARRKEAATVLVTCNPDWASAVPPATSRAIECAIVPAVGPEILAGSSRLKAGTATKMVLNMITTGAMIRWGRVYDNLMVDLVATNRKLCARATRLVESIGGVDAATAQKLLERTGWRVKHAVVMACRGVSAEESEAILARHAGRLRAALEET